MDNGASVAARISVRALLWGRTDADLWRALDHARRAPSRNTWQFVDEQQECVTSTTCPLDLMDRKALAADQGYGWAYVVLRADDGEAK